MLIPSRRCYLPNGDLVVLPAHALPAEHGEVASLCVVQRTASLKHMTHNNRRIAVKYQDVVKQNAAVVSMEVLAQNPAEAGRHVVQRSS